MAFTVEQAEKAFLAAAQDYHVDSDADDTMRVIRAALAYADARYPLPQAAVQPVKVTETMLNAVNRSTVDEIQRHVLNFFEGNWEKVDAWFAAINPAFGLSPNTMIAHGRHVYLLEWVRQQVEENKPPPTLVSIPVVSWATSGSAPMQPEAVADTRVQPPPDDTNEDIFFLAAVPVGEVFRTVDHEPGSMIYGMKAAMKGALTGMIFYVNGNDGHLLLLPGTTRVRLCSVC